ncbi:MAG: MFS transporter, partial [Chloroflexota bacterium]|nr:MFS transporter [Chloroflexota bacterium]
GAGSAVMMPSAYTLGARVLPNRRATAVGVMGAGNNLALAVGPALGLTLYGRYGAAGLFLPAGGAAGVGLLLALFAPRQPVEKTAFQFGWDGVWLRSLVANALQAVYFGGIVAYLPLYLHHVHGPNAGIFFSADALGVLLLRVPTGLLVDRRGSLFPKLLGIALTLGGLLALAVPPSLTSLIAGGAGTGVGAGLFITGIMADLANQSTDANRGTAMALNGSSFSAGIFIGGAISGLLIGPGGFSAILLFGGITTLIAFPFAARRRQVIPMG